MNTPERELIMRENLADFIRFLDHTLIVWETFDGTRGGDTARNRIIKMHFGIGCCPMDFKEIGKVLGLGKARVAQLFEQGCRYLRQAAEKQNKNFLAVS